MSTQGLVLDCSPLPWVSLEDFEPPQAASSSNRLPVWLALDEVTDPVSRLSPKPDT